MTAFAPLRIVPRPHAPAETGQRCFAFTPVTIEVVLGHCRRRARPRHHGLTARRWLGIVARAFEWSHPSDIETFHWPLPTPPPRRPRTKSRRVPTEPQLHDYAPRKQRDGARPRSLGLGALTKRERREMAADVAELTAAGVYDHLPTTSRACRPRACPWCDHLVAMRVDRNEGERQPRITCPDCKGRVGWQRGATPDSWSWEKHNPKRSLPMLSVRDGAGYERALNTCHPCAKVSCRHHLKLEVDEFTHAVKDNFPGVDISDMVETCSLRVAESVPAGETMPHIEVGARLNITLEWARVLEIDASRTLKRKLLRVMKPEEWTGG